MFNPDRFAARPFLFHLVASAASFLIIFSRRPDAVTNPQFWAEDGRMWYAQAYNNGVIESLLTPEAGYFQTVSRLVAALAQIFPLAHAPLVFNLAAFAVKIAVVNFILSSRLASIVPSLAVRALIAFIYLALPHTGEVHANLTNAQWHLAILSFLVIIAPAAEKKFWHTFDYAAVALSALSGPFCLLLVPVAAIKFYKTRDDKRLLGLLAILSFSSLIQIGSLLTTPRPSAQPLGASLEMFFKILGGHLFVSSTVGETGYARILERSRWNLFGSAFVTISGLAIIVYAFVKGNLEVRLLIFFAFLVGVSALANPAVTKEVPQWTELWFAGVGGRYWLIPIFSFFVCLIFLAKEANIKLVKYVAVGLLVLSVYGMARDWQLPGFQDFEFQKHAAEFERAPAGAEVSIPINPTPWDMRLVKKP